MISVVDIQQEFPDPVSCHSDRTHKYHYCVGGAVCQSVGMLYDFPRRSILAVALRRLNPQLKEEIAYRYALAIINLNDDFEFDEAWAVVDRVLNTVTRS